MDLAMIGLGRMGSNMALRLARGGHRVVVNNDDAEKSRAFVAEVPTTDLAVTLAELHGLLSPPRIAWVMVPAGAPTEEVIADLLTVLDPGDVVIDGGNSNYRDTVRRAGEVTSRGLEFVDVGTSGGVWGVTEGYSLMVGGTPEAVELLKPVLQTLSPGHSTGWGTWGLTGPATSSK